MPGHLPRWMGDLHEVLPHAVCWLVVTLAAVLCGAVVGVERERRQKPAGLRTMMLIALGASVFAQASLLFGGPGADRARVAAQVVTGVGFLGAGAIIHGRGLVSGFTTAAAIWVVAAIGVVIGGGYVVAGLFFTAVAAGTLAAERRIESMLYGGCRWATARVEFEPADGRNQQLIQDVLDDHQVPDGLVDFRLPDAGPGEVTIRYCHLHRQHRSFLPALARLHGVRRIAVQRSD